MLTALTIAAALLGQPPSTCATCGGHPPGATGGFPLDHHTAWDRIRNFCNGEILGFSISKCPCPLGMSVPYGDSWAMQMHSGIPVTTPTTAPAPPAPAAPSTTAPAQPPAPNPAAGPGAAPPLPSGRVSPFELPPATPPGGASTPLP